MKIWMSVYLATLLVFAVFSYTQVDLNLTLFNFKPYLNIQDQLNQLGYYHRPENTTIFFLILILLNLFYLFFLKQSFRGRLKNNQVRNLVIITGIILFLGYNVFSHDLFNYLFDARIITTYHLNPYIYKPLDFPSDTWIRFMHWVHVPSVYPPLWILISLVPSFLGLGKFALTLYLFRALFFLSYLSSCFFIYKITRSNFAVILFALNPLVLAEGLLSPHVDMVMASFGLAAIYFFLNAKLIKSYVFWLISIGIKYITLVFLPIFNKPALKLLGKNQWLKGIFWLSVLGVLVLSYFKGLQTWYLLLPLSTLPLVADELDSRITLTLALIAGLSIFRYFVFINLGYS